MLIHVHLWPLYFSACVLYYNKKFTLKISDILGLGIEIIATHEFFLISSSLSVLHELCESQLYLIPFDH